MCTAFPSRCLLILLSTFSRRTQCLLYHFASPSCHCGASGWQSPRFLRQTCRRHFAFGVSFGGSPVRRAALFLHVPRCGGDVRRVDGDVLLIPEKWGLHGLNLPARKGGTVTFLYRKAQKSLKPPGHGQCLVCRVQVQTKYAAGRTRIDPY